MGALTLINSTKMGGGSSTPAARRRTDYRLLDIYENAAVARVDAGEWVLIWGSGGGVATAALAIAGALGARVAVAASSPAKLERACALGAEAAFDSGDADLPARIRELTGGGAHVVIDDVGEATWARTLAAARRGGRVVVCGATTGSNPPAQLHRIWWRELTVFGSSLGGPADFQGAYELVVSGRARPVVDSVYPLAEAREAHERLERGEQVGKIVLRIPG
jgi:NADPH:quinone reductase-like Zn-dependent oxidoreductase